MADTLYFVTCCTELRRPGLTDPIIARRLIEMIREIDRAADSRTFGFTVMPDHMHWVFQLGERLSLGQLIAKFKVGTRAHLQPSGLNWQRNYYEHRLRPDETPEDYALYVFLNPYRADLIAAHAVWPCWWSGQPVALRFAALLNANGSPPSEWISAPVPASVRHGE